MSSWFEWGRGFVRSSSSSSLVSLFIRSMVGWLFGAMNEAMNGFDIHWRIFQWWIWDIWRLIYYCYRCSINKLILLAAREKDTHTHRDKHINIEWERGKKGKKHTASSVASASFVFAHRNWYTFTEDDGYGHIRSIMTKHHVICSNDVYVVRWRGKRRRRRKKQKFI